MRYLIKLRNSDPSETFSRLPAVSISLGDSNSVTEQSNKDKSETNESGGSFLNRRQRQITVKRYFQRPAMFLKRYFQTRTTVSINWGRERVSHAS